MEVAHNEEAFLAIMIILWQSFYDMIIVEFLDMR